MQPMYHPEWNIAKCILKMKVSEHNNWLIVNDGELNHFNINKILVRIIKQDVDIEKLDLSNNLIDGAIHWNFLSNFKNLKTLILNDNKLQSHNDEINWKLLPDSLQVLDLSKNMYLKGKIIWNELPKNLKVLDISQTSIICKMDWNEIKKTNLIEICVDYNQISSSLRDDPLPLNWRMMTKSRKQTIFVLSKKDYE